MLAFLKLLDKIDVTDAVITEHVPDGAVTGTVISGGIEGGVFFAVRWRQHAGGHHRNTLFSAQSWEASRDGDILRLERKAPDTDGQGDLPQCDVNTYTITLAPKSHPA